MKLFVGCWLQPLGSSMFMRSLYGARYTRFYLLKSMSRFASGVSQQVSDCNQRLMHRLSYVEGSLKKRLVGWAGDKLHGVHFHAYADADFAGYPRTLHPA